LPGYDYSKPGAYFVTMCTRNGRCLFGEICDGRMSCNLLGELVRSHWLDIPRHFPHVTLDAFVLMPDHLHGVLIFGDVVGVEYIRPLHVVVATFKAAVSRNARINIWQRNYYAHIVRNDDDLNRIRHYIDDNPRHAP
jgi:REP element-mobilizing transposase RayT